MATLQETKQFHAKLVAYITNHPELTYQQISDELGISVPAISKIARKAGIERTKPVRRFKLTPEILEKLEG